MSEPDEKDYFGRMPLEPGQIGCDWCAGIGFHVTEDDEFTCDKCRGRGWFSTEFPEPKE